MALLYIGEPFQHNINADLGEGMRRYVCSGVWGSGDRIVQMKTTHVEGDDYSKPFTEYQMGFQWWKKEYYQGHHSNTFISRGA